MTHIKLHNLYFTTFTVYKWQNVFLESRNVKILLDTMGHFKKENKATIYAFVIMPNHVHILWVLNDPTTIDYLTQSFQSYTSKLILNNIPNKEKFISNKKDRHFQIWETKPLSVEIWSKKFFFQKFHYIHNNALKGGLEDVLGEYEFSSYKSYEDNHKYFDFLTFWQEEFGII